MTASFITAVDSNTRARTATHSPMVPAWASNNAVPPFFLLAVTTCHTMQPLQVMMWLGHGGSPLACA